MDPYLEAFVQLHVHIDAGNRAFVKGVEVPVHTIGGKRKIELPGSKVLWTFDDLKRIGAKVDVVTLFSLARAGAEGRWRENIEERKNSGLPSNVYVANARTINRAIERGLSPPPATYIGRVGREMTAVHDNVDAVVDDLLNRRWRTTFRRGSRKERK